MSTYKKTITIAQVHEALAQYIILNRPAEITTTQRTLAVFEYVVRTAKTPLPLSPDICCQVLWFPTSARVEIGPRDELFIEGSVDVSKPGQSSP